MSWEQERSCLVYLSIRRTLKRCTNIVFLITVPGHFTYYEFFYDLTLLFFVLSLQLDCDKNSLHLYNTMQDYLFFQ